MPKQDENHLLADESFISYCLQRRRQDVEYWEHYIKTHPEQQEKIRELKTIILLTAQTAQELEWQEQLSLLKQKMGKAHEHSGPVKMPDQPVRRLFRKWAIAASIAGVLAMGGSTWYYLSRSATVSLMAYTSKPGERKSFQLPDGSTVVLNAGSHLSFSDDFNRRNRTVRLDGEAYFDVVHNSGKPFIVQTDKMDVKVLGTSFNIKAYPDDAAYEAALIRGSIELTLKQEKKTMLLRPKEKYVLENKVKENDREGVNITVGATGTGLKPILKVGEDSTIAEVAWLQNKLVFKDEPLSEVIKKLERWYGVAIELEDPSLGAIPYSGTFRNESIREVLTGLQFSEPFAFSEENGKIIIKK
jgi:transmembrane sensor